MIRSAKLVNLCINLYLSICTISLLPLSNITESTTDSLIHALLSRGSIINLSVSNNLINPLCFYGIKNYKIYIYIYIFFFFLCFFKEAEVQKFFN